MIFRDNKRKRAFVKWSDYPDQFNSWVPMRHWGFLLILFGSGKCARINKLVLKINNFVNF